MSSPEINLSYFIITYNKLPYLKDSLGRAIAAKQPDEEIIVIDGGSTDGTPEYLKELYERGDIEQYVSERDLGVGHAVNKAFLRARGKLVKGMNDDDEYYFDEVQKCKAFMLEHPEIDIINSNGIGHDGKEYRREEDFLKRKTMYHPFMMADQGMITRRSSLAVTGIADASFTFWDGEFTVRVTAGKSRMAWYTGITWKHDFNPDSVSLTRRDIYKAEMERLKQMYPIYSKWRHYVPKPIRDLIRFFVPKKRYVNPEEVKEPTFLT